MRQASLLCTCASDGGQHPGLTIIHGPPLAFDPLSQDGRAAPALVQQGLFLGGLDLRGGQDTLLLEGVQLFGEMWMGKEGSSQFSKGGVNRPPAWQSPGTC